MNPMNNMLMPANPATAAAPGAGILVPAGAAMQQSSPQQMQAAAAPAMPQQPQQDKMDNITKVKSLMPSLRDSISMSLKSAAQIVHQNHGTDSTSQKNGEAGIAGLDKNLEEFHSICDQMELHLKTAITCIQQSQSAAHYLPQTVLPSKLDSTTAQETTLSYTQHLNTVRLQISYAKDIHDTLVAAAQNISPTE